MSRLRALQMPLRLRLTLWYTFSLGLILLIFTIFIYVQIRRGLIAQVDAGLYMAANQALLDVGSTGGQLAFQQNPLNPDAILNLSDDFVIQLLSQDGTVVDTITRDDQTPSFPAPLEGYKTQLDGLDPWRVYRQAVEIDSTLGWIQVEQELDPVNHTLAGLQKQIAWAIPIALLLASIGGYFLASRALRPIDHITKTAQVITANDLGQRIEYRGPADEVGRLAQTFDAMLDRLQGAFIRERRFTDDAAHELRTPLTALKGHIGVSLSKPRRTAEYQGTLHDLEGQVDRLIRLSNDLLLIARLGQEQYKPHFERIDLSDFMGAVIDQIRPLAEAKAISLTADIPDHMALIGDIELLIRLFLNILDNAVKYTPQDGRITLTAQPMAGNLQISISDTGPGISAEHLPNLFDRFYRIENDRSRQLSDNGQSGAGLGLAIANEITRFHGGKLIVESQVSQGTTFIVELPAANSSGKTKPPPAT